MRQLALAWSIALGSATALSGQEPGAAWVERLFRAPSRPDYVGELARGTRLRETIQLPAPPAGRPPVAVRGVYLNAWVFGSERFYNLVRLADSTEVNSFVIDVKDDTGYLTYRSAVPTAIAIGANGRTAANDVRKRLSLLHAKGIHPIARIVVAKDPLLASHKSNWAIHDINGGLWRDAVGNAWVDAYRDSVWMYAADLAAEAVLQGFQEVQFDYVRFPDEPKYRMQRAIYPGREGDESQRRAVTRNVGLLQRRVASLGVPFTLDVFGLTTSAETDMGIGQVWDDLVHVADVILPMVYPSHYGRGSYGFHRPNFEPYRVVRKALEDGIRRSNQVGGRARIRPYLQSFTLGKPRYTPVEIRAQIQATEDVGLTDWILWNARGVYPAGAFRRRGAEGAASAS